MSVLIPLSHNQIAIVDDEDYELIKDRVWRAWEQTTYQGIKYHAVSSIYSNGVSKTVSMHRLILKAAKGVKVDHKDHDTLNNRRYNIRLATASQNAYNKSKQIDNVVGHKGVCKHYNKFKAQIQVDGKKLYLGLFDTVELASEAYKQAALEYHKEFANW